MDGNVGINFGRGRGPFTDPVADGFAEVCCLFACGVAFVNWSRPSARAFAVLTGTLCLAGALVSAQRSVWLGGVVGIALTLLVAPRVRRVALPLLLLAPSC